MSKGIRKDLTGLQVGRLTVLNIAPKIKGRIAWRCQCSCGQETILRTQNITGKYKVSSCGCLQREAQLKDLTGQLIGLWTVIAQTARRSAKGYVYWHCRCACGREKEVCAESLLAGKSSACRVCCQAFRKQRYCCHGHDTEEWGRTSSCACRACVKDKFLRTHYGISLEEFIALYKAQNGRCAICSREFGDYIPRASGWGNGSRIEVDHDHKKAKRHSVRGLLCGGRWAGCNRRLGRVDKPDWLRSVLAYLEHPPAQDVLNPPKEQ